MSVETVYRASLALDAHMIQDLLQRAGIPSRVDGEYLQGAMGELPPGDLVRVRVDSEHAAEARRVIAEWESALAKETPASQAASSSQPASRKSNGALAFAIGAGLAAFSTWWLLRTPVTQEGIDYDNDGTLDERHYYLGPVTKRSEIDRNFDGKVDSVYEYDAKGLLARIKLDDDFDGRFESVSHAKNNQFDTTYFDRDGDGSAEEIWRYSAGVLVQRDFLDRDSLALVKRQTFKHGVLVSAQIDSDRDGKLDRTTKYDRFEEPR